MYYVLLGEQFSRSEVLGKLGEMNINAVFHYVPLHSSPAGIKYGRVSSEMEVTDRTSARLIRIPLWAGMPLPLSQKVVSSLVHVLTSFIGQPDS